MQGKQYSVLYRQLSQNVYVPYFCGIAYHVSNFTILESVSTSAVKGAKILSTLTTKNETFILTISPCFLLFPFHLLTEFDTFYCNILLNNLLLVTVLTNTFFL